MVMVAVLRPEDKQCMPLRTYSASCDVAEHKDVISVASVVSVTDGTVFSKRKSEGFW